MIPYNQDKILYRKAWEVGRSLGNDIEVNKIGEDSYTITDGGGVCLNTDGFPVFTEILTWEEANIALDGMRFAADWINDRK